MANIAVLGYGTVGSGVVEVLNTNKDRIFSNFSWVTENSCNIEVFNIFVIKIINLWKFHK